MKDTATDYLYFSVSCQSVQSDFRLEMPLLTRNLFLGRNVKSSEFYVNSSTHKNEIELIGILKKSHGCRDFIYETITVLPPRLWSSVQSSNMISTCIRKAFFQ